MRFSVSRAAGRGFGGFVQIFGKVSDEGKKIISFEKLLLIAIRYGMRRGGKDFRKEPGLGSYFQNGGGCDLVRLDLAGADVERV